MTDQDVKSGTDPNRDDSDWVCQVCEESFASETALRKHVKRIGLVE